MKGHKYFGCLKCAFCSVLLEMIYLPILVLNFTFNVDVEDSDLIFCMCHKLLPDFLWYGLFLLKLCKRRTFMYMNRIGVVIELFELQYCGDRTQQERTQNLRF